MILSLPAYLYVADAELANNLKKLSKSNFKKKDHTHPGQLAYVHWINAVRDSMLIIRRHGLIPEQGNYKHLRHMFPPLSAIIDHFNSKDKTVKRQACNEVVQFFFSSKKKKEDFLELWLHASLANRHSTMNLGASLSTSNCFMQMLSGRYTHFTKT